MKKIIFLFCILSSLSTALAESEESEILEKLESLSRMRESLASGVSHLKPSEITEQTFKNVCQPVGMELKRWAKAKGYLARQISLKPRGLGSNPLPDEIKILNIFAKDPAKENFQHVTTEASIRTISIYKRIQVAQSCLACHGEKKLRPDFIKTKYPKDLAYGFKAGDFRGLFVVTFKK